MATQPTNPFSSSQRGGMVPRDNTTQRLALDNLLRRELNVSDPSDAQQVANALLSLYQDTPKAIAINREAEGVPFLSAPSAMPMMTPQATSSDVELQQAIADVDRDLQELTTNSLLKDVKVELEGWAAAVRFAIADGVNAARFALDTRQRDKALGIRRTLGDYARMARLVGALTPSLNTTYRKFAQSLDEVASVMLVMMGEALANLGFSGGRFLLQVPYSELQTRRDAVIHALRNLTGSTQEAYGPNEWPRGLDAYRRLYEELERQGQGDLRSLLVETEIARIMDNLIHRIDHGNVEGLRQIGSTAQLDLQRFRRLIIIAQRLVRPESPPLTTFLSALQLFTQAFNSAGGFRLMKIARPPILFYGLYGTTSLDDSDQILLNLIRDRGLLADELDCLLSCGCDENTVKCQILLDKILYDIDRAIDLYIMSAARFGLPERRASAYSFIINSFINAPSGSSIHTALDRAAPGAKGRINNLENTLLTQIYNYLEPPLVWLEGAYTDLATLGKQLQDILEADPNNNLCDMNGHDFCNDNPNDNTNLETASLAYLSGLLAETISFNSFAALFNEVNSARSWLEQNGINNVPNIPIYLETEFINIINQELCIQEDAEQQWENLVATMAPSCIRFAETIFPVLQELVQSAKAIAGGRQLEAFDIKIPPHYETSLDSVVFGFDSDGSGRI